MAESLRRLDDLALGAALRDLGRALETPAAAPPGRPDLATRVRASIVALPSSRAGRGRWWDPVANRQGRRVRTSLVLAIALILALVAAAIGGGFDLPGLRFLFGPRPTTTSTTTPTPAPIVGGSPSPGATPAPLGGTLGLGLRQTLGQLAAQVDFPILLPDRADLGDPEIGYLSRGRIALLWRTSPSLPPTTARDVGLLLSEFRGRLDDGYVQKMIDSGTSVEPVTVGDGHGYWIDGVPHFFMYIDGSGRAIEDTHRAVGDTLVWTTGEITYRIESSVGRQATIAIAESLVPLP